MIINRQTSIAALASPRRLSLRLSSLSTWVSLSFATGAASRTSSSKLTLRLLICLFTPGNPLTPPLHPSLRPPPLSLFFPVPPLPVVLPISLPSLGVKGALPLLESPVELDGLSLLVTANGLDGIGKLDGLADTGEVCGNMVLLRCLCPPFVGFIALVSSLVGLELSVICLTGLAERFKIGALYEDEEVEEGIRVLLLCLVPGVLEAPAPLLLLGGCGRDVTLNAGGGARSLIGIGAIGAILEGCASSLSVSSSSDSLSSDSVSDSPFLEMRLIPPPNMEARS